MKPTGLYFLTILTTCLIVTSSCSQKSSTAQLPPADSFVGSTPCDSLIKSLLQIPSSTKCEFIKWELSLQKNSLDTFHMAVLYGESKPNTNGFMGGGEKIEMSGKYTTGYGTGTNSKAKVYSLRADKFQSPFLLIEMDSNILHFADANNNFITGNGGFGYVLNRIQQ